MHNLQRSESKTDLISYGLQLCAKTRLNDQAKTNMNLEALQTAQNRLLKLLDGCFIKDRKSIKFLPCLS